MAGFPKPKKVKNQKARQSGFGTGGDSALSRITPKPEGNPTRAAPTSQRQQGDYVRHGTDWYAKKSIDELRNLNSNKDEA